MKEIILSGRVQGVFCRHYCSQNAKKLGIRGSATNLSDGSVRVIVDCEGELLHKYLSHLRDNPYGIRFWGKITDIQVNDFKGNPGGDYEF